MTGAVIAKVALLPGMEGNSEWAVSMQAKSSTKKEHIWSLFRGFSIIKKFKGITAQWKDSGLKQNSV